MVVMAEGLQQGSHSAVAALCVSPGSTVAYINHTLGEMDSPMSTSPPPPLCLVRGVYTVWLPGVRRAIATSCWQRALSRERLKVGGPSAACLFDLVTGGLPRASLKLVMPPSATAGQTAARSTLTGRAGVGPGTRGPGQGRRLRRTVGRLRSGQARRQRW